MVCTRLKSYLFSMEFPNEYNMRKVATPDSKACFICYKPTETVLVSQNKADFFYVCAGHLLDSLFAEPIHEELYKKLVLQKEELEKQVPVKEEKALLLKPYIWNKLAKSDPEKDKKYTEAVEAVNKAKEELAQIENEIAQFTFKRYTLNADVHKLRIQGIQRTRNERARQQKLQADLQSETFFPQVPKGKIG